MVIERVNHTAHARIGLYLSAPTHPGHPRCHRCHRCLGLGSYARFLIPRRAPRCHKFGDQRLGKGSPIHQQLLQDPNKGTLPPLRMNKIPRSNRYVLSSKVTGDVMLTFALPDATMDGRSSFRKCHRGAGCEAYPRSWRDRQGNGFPFDQSHFRCWCDCPERPHRIRVM